MNQLDYYWKHNDKKCQKNITHISSGDWFTEVIARTTEKCLKYKDQRQARQLKT